MHQNLLQERKLILILKMPRKKPQTMSLITKLKRSKEIIKEEALEVAEAREAKEEKEADIEATEEIEVLLEEIEEEDLMMV